MYTIGELLIKGYDILKVANIESYQIDCQLLLSYVLEKDKLAIILNRNEKIDDFYSDIYMKLVYKRAKRMPIKYIIGQCEFMGINFSIKEGVLIPRPDTETLVESVIQDINKNKFNKVCDVCCGSGIIGISIAKITSIDNVLCLDISEKSIENTKENIKNLSLGDKVSVFKSDTLSYPITKNEKFDVVVSNPPYIKTSDIPELMEDVKDYEPYEALWGGDDGIDFYRKITQESTKILIEGGLLAFEIGFDEKERVQEIMDKNGFNNITCINDLAGLNRVVKGYFKKH